MNEREERTFAVMTSIYVIDMAQPFWLHQEKKTSSDSAARGLSFRVAILDATDSTSKVAAVKVIVNLRQPKITNNELKWQKIS